MEGKATSLERLHDRETAILKRLADGLSDQQIADDLCLSLHTVKWYNRQIYAKLGVKRRTQAIVCAQNLGVLHNDSAGAPLPAPGYQLPVQSAPFIGRSRELSEVKQLLSSSRLLTLTGTGGTGKTRLALQVAEEIAVMFADGVCFIDLAPLADHTLVMKAIAGRACGIMHTGVYDEATRRTSSALGDALSLKAFVPPYPPPRQADRRNQKVTSVDAT